jgi:signal recognition particle GTPase
MSRTVVAAELRARISRAIEEMTNATVMDEKTRRKKCLNQITRILFRSRFHFTVVQDMHAKIKDTILNLDDLTAANEIVQQIVFTERCKMLDPDPVPVNSC